MSAGAAWVLGGGSGIGRAAAVALAGSADVVVLSGRRTAELEEGVRLVTAAGGRAEALPCDVTDRASVTAAAAAIADRHGALSTVVYSAGTNTPRRFWTELSTAEVARVVEVNLLGAVAAVEAALPALRRGGGVVVLVSSWAGWRRSPGAGAAYSMSKTALGVLAESLNAEEHASGIRATHLCPGEVATDILDTRPEPPGPEARALMLAPDDVGDAIRWIVSLPPRVCVNELVLTPTANSSYAGG